jgi:hypothetical protein
MFSLQFPELTAKLAEAGPGLWPFKRLDTGEYMLAIKGSGDLPLAAKLRGKFKIHFYDLSVSERHALGIITAFYDQANAPLIIRTVCGDPLNAEIVSAISSPSLAIAFFDMHNSELFSGIWKLTPMGDIPSFVKLPVEFEPHEAALLDFYVEIHKRFSNPLDDGFVIEAELIKSEHREDLTVMHVTEEEVFSRRGEGHGIYVSQLDITEKPGDFHEAEIARALARIYSPSRVFVGPATDKTPEFCDVLAVGTIEAICIQAKSTLRDFVRATESDIRRKARATKHFKKASRQVWGAERAFYHLGEKVLFNSQPIGISATSTLLMHIIVIFEKHSELLEAWSPIVRALRDKGVFVVVLDTAEFQNMVNTYRTQEEFGRALFAIEENFDRDGGIGEHLFHRNRMATFGRKQ